jgi:hypothetical protein
MPGAAEPAKRRAQPGALDLIEVNSAGRIVQHRASCIVRQLSAVVMAARLLVDR